MVQDDYLELFRIGGMWTQEDISRMGITMHETRHKDLIGKGSDYAVDYPLLTEPEFTESSLIRDFDAIYPLGYHDARSRELINDFWHMEF